MVKLPIPESALDGTYSTPMTPAAGPMSGTFPHPLAIPGTLVPGNAEGVEHGPSEQESQYDYNTENFGVC